MERYQQSSHACLKPFCVWLPAGDSFSLIIIFYTKAISTFWQWHVMVCCIGFCVSVIQGLHYIRLVSVIANKCRIHLVCSRNLTKIFELKYFIIFCVFKMAGFFCVLFSLEWPELLTVLVTSCVSRKILCLIHWSWDINYMTCPEYEFSLQILYFKDAEEVKELQILLRDFLS